MSEPNLRCGSRSLVQLVDYYAATSPDRVHSYVQSLGKIEDPFTTITYQILANSVNRAAQWLEIVGGVLHETVAFLGCSDLRSIIFFLAGAKLNITVRFAPPIGTPRIPFLTYIRLSCSIVIHQSWKMSA
jgi:acyl-CoA synthetase (AMP-forming)/AMP-acid ligase II